MNKVIGFSILMAIVSMAANLHAAEPPAPGKGTTPPPPAALTTAPSAAPTAVAAPRPFVRVRGRVTDSSGRGLEGVELHWEGMVPASGGPARPNIPNFNIRDALARMGGDRRQAPPPCSFDETPLTRSPAARTRADGSYEIVISTTGSSDECYILIQQISMENIPKLIPRKAGYSFTGGTARGASSTTPQLGIPSPRLPGTK